MIGKSFALAGTLVLSALVGSASADLKPLPRGRRSPRRRCRRSSTAGAAVFSTASADWVKDELWVESSFDSDRDGKPDRIHVDVSRPKESDTDGLKSR